MNRVETEGELQAKSLHILDNKVTMVQNWAMDHFGPNEATW